MIILKAVFLDRDGTINVEKNYLHSIKDFEILPGVIAALKLLQDAGYLLVIITNQSGIARGYYTEKDFNTLNDWMIKMLSNHGILISKVYYCPHLPDAQVKLYRQDCDCRKPKLGMYVRAIEEFGVDLSRSYAVGDKIRDCAICENTECAGFLIGRNEDIEIINAVKGKKYRNVEYAEDLLECVRKIVETERTNR